MGKRTLIIHCLKQSLQHFWKACAKQWQGQTLEFSIALRNRPHKCMYFSISHATKRQEFICALLKASPWWDISVWGNKVSVCTAWHSPQCRNGCICDKYTRQTNCSKAGGEPTDATRDLVFSRHKPLLNSAGQQISFTALLRDWETVRRKTERIVRKSKTDRCKEKKTNRKENWRDCAGPGSNTAPNEILLYHQSKASAPSTRAQYSLCGNLNCSPPCLISTAPCGHVCTMSNVFP